MSASFIAACKERSADAEFKARSEVRGILAAAPLGILALPTDVFSVLTQHLLRADVLAMSTCTSALVKGELEPLSALKQVHAGQHLELKQRLVMQQKLPNGPPKPPEEERWYKTRAQRAQAAYREEHTNPNRMYREEQHGLAVQMLQLQQGQNKQRTLAYEAAFAAAEQKASALWPWCSNSAGTVALTCRSLYLAISPHLQHMDRAAARIQGHVRRCSQNRFFAEKEQHQCDVIKARVSHHSYHSAPPKDPKNGLTAKGMYELQVWCSLERLLRQLEPWFDGGCGGFRLGYSSTVPAPPDEGGRRYTIRVFNITWDDRHERYEKREKDHLDFAPWDRQQNQRYLRFFPQYNY